MKTLLFPVFTISAKVQLFLGKDLKHFIRAHSVILLFFKLAVFFKKKKKRYLLKVNNFGLD